MLEEHLKRALEDVVEAQEALPDGHAVHDLLAEVELGVQQTMLHAEFVYRWSDRAISVLEEE